MRDRDTRKMSWQAEAEPSRAADVTSIKRFEMPMMVSLSWAGDLLRRMRAVVEAVAARMASTTPMTNLYLMYFCFCL